MLTQVLTLNSPAEKIFWKQVENKLEKFVKGRHSLEQLSSRQSIRPLSLPFLLRTSGKWTDTATMLRLEKYGRIDTSLRI